MQEEELDVPSDSLRVELEVVVPFSIAKISIIMKMIGIRIRTD